jgi:uncharacterized protein (DUF4415 family)
MDISKKRIAELKKLQDDNKIDYSEISELDNNFWANAKLSKSPKKKPITIRIDQDLYDYYKNTGDGYQTYINSVLRVYAENHGLQHN